MLYSRGGADQVSVHRCVQELDLPALEQRSCVILAWGVSAFAATMPAYDHRGTPAFAITGAMGSAASKAKWRPARMSTLAPASTYGSLLRFMRGDLGPPCSPADAPDAEL